MTIYGKKVGISLLVILLTLGLNQAYAANFDYLSDTIGASTFSFLDGKLVQNSPIALMSIQNHFTMESFVDENEQGIQERELASHGSGHYICYTIGGRRYCWCCY